MNNSTLDDILAAVTDAMAAIRADIEASVRERLAEIETASVERTALAIEKLRVHAAEYSEAARDKAALELKLATDQAQQAIDAKCQILAAQSDGIDALINALCINQSGDGRTIEVYVRDTAGEKRTLFHHRALGYVGEYDKAAEYKKGDIVSRDGAGYIAIMDNPNEAYGEPPTNDGWACLAARGEKGDPGPQGFEGRPGVQGIPGQDSPYVQALDFRQDGQLAVGFSDGSVRYAAVDGLAEHVARLLEQDPA